MNSIKPLILIASCSAVVGCASMTPTTERIESFAIYNVQPNEGTTTGEISNAMEEEVRKEMSEVRINSNIPPSPLPEEPPRFKMTDAFSGTQLGALAAASGNSLSVPSCEEAVMTLKADDTSMSQYGENTVFHLCLQPYTEGYNIDIYTAFTKKSGGFSAATLGATLARSVTGDSSQFLPRTIDGIVTGVEEAGAEVTLVESYPPE